MSFLKSITKSLTYTDRKGYKKVKGINTPVHRIVAAIKIGRPLKSEERVHHENRKKYDNSFGNLTVCKNQKEHQKIHDKLTKKYGKKVSYKGK